MSDVVDTVVIGAGVGVGVASAGGRGHDSLAISFLKIRCAIAAAAP